MEVKMEKKDWLFLLLCLLVGVIAEEAFFKDRIGISYFVFIVAFYALFFWRFRSFSFTHQRFGYLLLISIWILAACYYLYDIALFYALNILAIPTLVIFHLALITSPKKIDWSSLYFIQYIGRRLVDSIIYNATFAKNVMKLSKNDSAEKKYDTSKKVLIGVAISIPFLAIILNLLISADAEFARIFSGVPNWLELNVEHVFRFIFILFFTFMFFGFFQVLLQKKIDVFHKDGAIKPIAIDGIIALTVLVLIDLVYVLFVAVQFKYFFSGGTLQAGFTYAEYARRGFFELLFVSLINLSITIAVIQFVKNGQQLLKRMIRVALTVLVLSSGVLLISAFMRMGMYEDAYGFTFTRVLVHSFMIFLMVILAYTLVKIWLEKLSLFHFYFMASLIYYVGINVVNLDQIVVDQNIARYEATGKIDIDYLNQLSATGIMGLIELYEKHPDNYQLKQLLQQRQKDRDHMNSDAWQSKNLALENAYKRLGELDF